MSQSKCIGELLESLLVSERDIVIKGTLLSILDEYKVPNFRLTWKICMHFTN